MKRLALLVVVGCVACEKVEALVQSQPEALPLPPAPAPAASLAATPVERFADAAPQPSAFEQAKSYEAAGQLVLGRFAIEGKALGPDATHEETELLARICAQQGDDECVEACAAKLGRRAKPDGGAARSQATPSAGQKAETDATRARALFQKKKYDAARKLLEPKVLADRAARDELQVLRDVCAAQHDRMCVALCDSKLK